MGLLALAEAGKDDAVRAVTALEGNVGELKLSYFRGWETLLLPDIIDVMAW